MSQGSTACHRLSGTAETDYLPVAAHIGLHALGQAPDKPRGDGPGAGEMVYGDMDAY